MTASGIPALLEPIQERWAAVGDLDQWYAPEEIQEALEHAGTAAEHIGPDSMAIAHAGTDTARLLAAVKAVVELHKPFTHHFLMPPAGSLEVCLACHEQWPCETMAAVEAALRGEA